MKFLVDAQLRARLCRWLLDQGHDGSRSTDTEVAAAVDSEDRIVVSKDAVFGANLADIVAALDESRFVEMTATELVVHSEPSTS